MKNHFKNCIEDQADMKLEEVKSGSSEPTVLYL